MNASDFLKKVYIPLVVNPISNIYIRYIAATSNSNNEELQNRKDNKKRNPSINSPH